MAWLEKAPKANYILHCRNCTQLSGQKDLEHTFSFGSVAQPVWTQFALLPTQLSDNIPEQAEMAQVLGALVHRMMFLAPDWLDPVLAVTAIWGVNQHIKYFYLSIHLSVCLSVSFDLYPSTFQLNKINSFLKSIKSLLLTSLNDIWANSLYTEPLVNTNR